MINMKSISSLESHFQNLSEPLVHLYYNTKIKNMNSFSSLKSQLNYLIQPLNHLEC